MGRLRTIARRTFLLGTVAIAGGVAFGVYKFRETAPNPLDPAEGEYSLNAWIMIDGKGVTLVAPKAEMGQGVHTTWAALIAEELDVELADVRVIHGPPAQAYFNSALFGLAIPRFEYRDGNFLHGLRGIAGEGAKFLSLQLTGGSTSMKDGFERMRAAGATAREALKMAAADRLGVARADLTTEAGHVVAPDGTRIPYSELAEAALDKDPGSVDLRDPSEWRLLGKTQPRIDMVSKVTGTAEFGVDVRLDGMRFASVRRNPSRSGMNGFDASAAEGLPGVEQIVDLGDGVAVVATNTWLAMQALDAIVFDWQPSIYAPDSAAIDDLIATSFDAEPNSTIRDDGDVDAAHDGTAVSAEYRLPFLAHTTMEPMNATAIYTGDSLTLWSGNQAPVSTRDKAAEAVGLAPEAVTVHTTLMGGGFGRRSDTDFSVVAAMVAKAVPNTPVMVVYDRTEDIHQDFFRPAIHARYEGVVKDGAAVSLHGKVGGPSVAKNTMRRQNGAEVPGADREHVSGAADQPYKIPNFRLSGYISPVNVPLGYWRSVGSSFNVFAFDSFIDEMAHAAGRDPLEFRIELARAEHAPSAAVLEAVGEMSGWGGDLPANRARGVGFGHTFGTPVAQVVEVEDTGAGIRLAKCWIACDPGTALDPGNIEAQMVGGAIYGFSAALFQEITFENGVPQQFNFPDYDAMRMNTAPSFEVRILQNAPHIGGVGEPGTPPAAPALANALFALTGQRARRLPLMHDFDLVF